MAVDSDGSDFSDDMALMPSMKAHTGGQGLGAASAPAAAVLLKKVAVHRPHAADVCWRSACVLCSSMTSPLLPGWTSLRRKLFCSAPPHAWRGLGRHECGRCERGAQGRHQALRRFLECPPSGSWRRTEQVQLLWEHGVRLCAPRCCRFEMARGPGASRKSISQGAVLAPVVVSAMFRTKLLGDATME